MRATLMKSPSHATEAVAICISGPKINTTHTKVINHKLLMLIVVAVCVANSSFASAKAQMKEKCFLISAIFYNFYYFA